MPQWSGKRGGHNRWWEHLMTEKPRHLVQFEAHRRAMQAEERAIVRDFVLAVTVAVVLLGAALALVVWSA